MGRVGKGVKEGDRGEQRGEKTPKNAIQHLSHDMANIWKLQQEAAKSPMSHTICKRVSWMLSPASERLANLEGRKTFPSATANGCLSDGEAQVLA